MKRPIGSSWDLFRSAVVPHDAPPTQVQEMRRAYYAGCAALFDIQMQMTAPDKTEEDGMDTMSSVQAELLEFAGQVQSGKR